MILNKCTKACSFWPNAYTCIANVPNLLANTLVFFGLQDIHQLQKLQAMNQELVAKNLSLEIANEQLSETLMQIRQVSPIRFLLPHTHKALTHHATARAHTHVALPEPSKKFDSCEGLRFRCGQESSRGIGGVPGAPGTEKGAPSGSADAAQGISER